MADIKEAIRRLIYQYTVEGADKVMATQEAVAASTTKTDKASLSLEKSFGGIERKYVDVVRAQQDYAKVQDKVNAAVAQNPALQERANVVLAEARKHFDNVATGAGKADMAATVLMRTMSRTIGPLALVGAAVAALSSAFEFMEPIAVRVGADIYRRFSEAYPAVAQFAESVYNAGEQFIKLEQGKAKVEAINAALKGTASAAQLAALKMETFNQEMARKIGLGEAAQAAERMADHIMRLAQIYPGVTQETAKQLELLDAQLAVARARTEEEKQIAEEKVRQVQLTQQGVEGDEQLLIIARERAKAEAEANKQREKSVYYSQNQTAATNDISAAQADVTDEAENTTNQIHSAGQQIQRNIGYTRQWYQIVDDIAERWAELTIAEGVATNLDLLIPQFGQQFGARTQYTSSYDPLHTGLQRATMEKLYGAGNIEPILVNGAVAGYKPTQEWIDAQNKLANAVEENTSSTDALNSTMQNALSPFYSQDPRTTHLGFRAGVVGNEDWLAAGASSQAGALAAILGSGATAPGMANGGSFMVGGGYSANDNRIAAFPVASGEEVIVNRNRKGGQGGQVIHIDNRTIINGRVDASVFAQMKVSKFQQTQRMRAGLAVA